MEFYDNSKRRLIEIETKKKYGKLQLGECDTIQALAVFGCVAILEIIIDKYRIQTKSLMMLYYLHCRSYRD